MLITNQMNSVLNRSYIKYMIGESPHPSAYCAFCTQGISRSSRLSTTL